MTKMSKEGFLEARPPGGFVCIYADPNWLFKNYSAKGERKNPNQHYECDSVDEIEDLPVPLLAAKDCWLWLWATFPMLPQALRVMDQWGFEYKAGAAWVKQSKRTIDMDLDDPDAKLQFGSGYIFRGAAEALLVGSRGRPKLHKTRAARSVRNVIVAPVREHSRKPDSVYDMIETRVPGPYVELFARNRRAGWVSLGNEVDKYGH